MNLGLYVENIHRQLAVAAEAGGDDARALAERLVAPLDAAIRLTLQDALAAAAEEITRELAPGLVYLRLRGGDLEFVVTPPPVDPSVDDLAEGADDRTPSGQSTRTTRLAGRSALHGLGALAERSLDCLHHAPANSPEGLQCLLSILPSPSPSPWRSASVTSGSWQATAATPWSRCARATAPRSLT